MQFTLGTGHRIADAAATSRVKMLAARALVIEAALLTTDLVRAADGPIGLSKTGTAFASIGVTLLTRWAVIDALIVATRLPGSTLDGAADSARARLTRLTLRLAITAMTAVDLRVNALVVAHRAVVAALALTVDAVVT